MPSSDARPKPNFVPRRFALAAALVLALALPAAAENFHVHGLLDLGLSGRGSGFLDNELTRGDSPFDPWGLRLFGEGTVGSKIGIFTQGVFHDPSSPYLEGAYAVYTPAASHDVHIMAGKIPCYAGTFAPRSY